MELHWSCSVCIPPEVVRSPFGRIVLLFFVSLGLEFSSLFLTSTCYLGKVTPLYFSMSDHKQDEQKEESKSFLNCLSITLFMVSKSSLLKEKMTEGISSCTLFLFSSSFVCSKERKEAKRGESSERPCKKKTEDKRKSSRITSKEECDSRDKTCCPFS